MPETKGLALAEMDVLFEERVSAREFRKREVAVFERELVVGSGEKVVV